MHAFSSVLEPKIRPADRLAGPPSQDLRLQLDGELDLFLCLLDPLLSYLYPKFTNYTWDFRQKHLHTNVSFMARVVSSTTKITYGD